MSPAERSLRAKAALTAAKVVAGASKAAGMGTGSVIGGRVALAVDHDLLASLTRDRDVALVSATNGKTTTTALLTAALSRFGPVTSNALGANMPPGIVAALGDADPAARAALEVDERWLPKVLAATGPATVVLGNLSRDQLDRSHEVRKIADTWRAALTDLPTRHVVANADDPLVVWAAGGAAARTDTEVIHVGTAAHWTLDATGCPSCGGRIRFDDGGGWACAACDFARPDPAWQLVDHGDRTWSVTDPDGVDHALRLALPGRVNAANAALVVAAAAAMGCELDRVLTALRTVSTVAGRYATATIGSTEVRLLLAKNPAGWQEAIEMVAPAPQPVVAAINARIADGRDPSWLWDVPFERLAGRLVIATGERRHDLAVRLRYADVDHAVASSLSEAVDLAEAGKVDYIGNYTAFQDELDALGIER